VNPRPSPSLVERPRSAHEIAGVLNRLLDEARFAPPGTDQLRDALVQIAARYGEIVTQCLNVSPDLHLEAFSELLPGLARPATAARVHVSFRRRKTARRGKPPDPRKPGPGPGADVYTPRGTSRR